MAKVYFDYHTNSLKKNSENTTIVHSTSDFGLPASDFRLPTSDFQLIRHDVFDNSR
jgi:hypothetical protein